MLTIMNFALWIVTQNALFFIIDLKLCRTQMTNF